MDIYTQLTKWANQSVDGSAEGGLWEELTGSKTTMATPCGYRGRFCEFSCGSLLWVIYNKTPFQLQGFLNCYLSWAEQPFPPSPDEKTETQRDKEMRPTTGDQIRLADLCSKGLVLQVKQRKKRILPIFVRAKMISNFQFIILGWGGCKSVKDRNIKCTVNPSQMEDL